jgi:hypothetical protein
VTRAEAFFSSPIEASNATDITFTDVGVGPCPRCGGNGHIPDGTYNFIGNAIQFLSGPTRSKRDLERLVAILRTARQRGASVEDIRREVANQLPELQSISDLLPRTRSELYAFIAILLTILTLLLGELRKGQPPKVEINQVINQITTVVEQPRQTAAQSQAPSSTAPKPAKVGRNDPCPCGSGKKYKKCHMIKQRRLTRRCARRAPG